MACAWRKRYAGLLLVAWLAAAATLGAQGLTVRGRVTLTAPGGDSPDNSNAVVWLTPLGEDGSTLRNSGLQPSRHFRLVQKHKQFTPHILVVPVGARVEFPNQDPFFHNVFSLFNGKRFDLGLYEAGSTRTVAFNSPGVSYIFCNIHPEMSAVVIVTEAPYYALSNRAGDIAIENVPAGHYQLNVWHERCAPEALKALAREIVVGPSSVGLGDLRLPESGDLLSKHKNLYGRDYDANASAYPSYDQP